MSKARGLLHKLSVEWAVLSFYLTGWDAPDNLASTLVTLQLGAGKGHAQIGHFMEKYASISLTGLEKNPMGQPKMGDRRCCS